MESPFSLRARKARKIEQGGRIDERRSCWSSEKTLESEIIRWLKPNKPHQTFQRAISALAKSRQRFGYRQARRGSRVFPALGVFLALEVASVLDTDNHG